MTKRPVFLAAALLAIGAAAAPAQTLLVLDKESATLAFVDPATRQVTALSA